MIKKHYNIFDEAMRGHGLRVYLKYRFHKWQFKRMEKRTDKIRKFLGLDK